MYKNLKIYTISFLPSLSFFVGSQWKNGIVGQTVRLIEKLQSFLELVGPGYQKSINIHEFLRETWSAKIIKAQTPINQLKLLGPAEESLIRMLYPWQTSSRSAHTVQSSYRATFVYPTVNKIIEYCALWLDNIEKGAFVFKTKQTSRSGIIKCL